MKTAKMMAMVVALLVCVAVPASAVVIQTGGDPLLFDGIKVDPSCVSALDGTDPPIEAVFDLGVQSYPVTGALITYCSGAAAGVYKPNPVDFYFSNIAGAFNPTPDATFDTTAWPQADGWSGWPITTDAEATAAGSGQYLKIVANYTAPGSWLFLYEIEPVLGSNMVTVQDGNWAAPATWDANRTPVSEDFPEVRHNVVVAAAGAVAQVTTLSQAASRLTVNPGATLNVGSGTGTVEVKDGILSADSGGLTAGTLDVTGGAGNVAGACSIGTVNASAGTANLGTNLTTALNVSGTGTVTTTAPVSVPTVTVSGGALNLGLSVGDLSVTDATVSGGAVNTQNDYLSVGNRMDMTGASITTSGPAFGVRGSGITSSITSIEGLKLGGGTVTINSSELVFSDDFNTYTGTPSGIQYETGLPLAHSSSVPGWSGSGAGAVHAVVLSPSPNNWAPMFYNDNQILLESGIAANTSGNQYEVSFKYGTADYAGGQATTAADGLIVEVLRADNSVVATGTFQPGAWSNPDNVNLSAGLQGTLSYTGDGTGDVRLLVRCLLLEGRFGGEIDDIAVTGQGALNLAATDVELAASTWLDLGGAPSPTFGDLIPVCPNGTTLRIMGTDWTAVSTLADWWDDSALYADLFTETGTDGSSWVELTYIGVVPEPAGLGLIGMAVLALRRRRA